MALRLSKGERDTGGARGGEGGPGSRAPPRLCSARLHLCVLCIRLMSDFVSRARAGKKTYLLMGRKRGKHTHKNLLALHLALNIFYQIPLFFKISREGVIH